MWKSPRRDQDGLNQKEQQKTSREMGHSEASGMLDKLRRERGELDKKMGLQSLMTAKCWDDVSLSAEDLVHKLRSECKQLDEKILVTSSHENVCSQGRATSSPLPIFRTVTHLSSDSALGFRLGVRVSENALHDCMVSSLSHVEYCIHFYSLDF